MAYLFAKRVGFLGQRLLLCPLSIYHNYYSKYRPGSRLANLSRRQVDLVKRKRETKLRSIRPLIFARCHQKEPSGRKSSGKFAVYDAAKRSSSRCGLSSRRSYVCNACTCTYKASLLRNIIVTTRVIVRGISHSPL